MVFEEDERVLAGRGACALFQATCVTLSGLTNFRGEWWHWSYGEPGWALRGGHPTALYGAIPMMKFRPGRRR